MDSVLLWMLFQGHIEHLQSSGNGRKGMNAVASVRFTKVSAFRLTPLGKTFGDEFVTAVLTPGCESVGAFWNMLWVGLLVPTYEKQDRILRWGEHLIKHFDRPADNQILVVSAAEELGWPFWWDDPLPRRHGQNPKTMLHDTIKDLNRRQKADLIRFKGDGTGTQIGWEYH